VRLFFEMPSAALQNPAIPMWLLEDPQLWKGVEASEERYNQWARQISREGVHELIFEGAKEYVLREGVEAEFGECFFEVDRYWIGFGGAVCSVRDGTYSYSVSVAAARIKESSYKELKNSEPS
jgi:hypothetical protein